MIGNVYEELGDDRMALSYYYEIKDPEAKTQDRMDKLSEPFTVGIDMFMK